MPHHQRELAIEELEHAVHAGLTERPETPEIRATDTDGLRAERERLEHVAAAPEPAVDEHANPPLHRGHHLGQTLDRRAPALLRAAPVIRHDDAVDAVSHGELRVLPGLDTLH